MTLLEAVEPDDVQGEHYDAVGRVSADTIRQYLPADDPEFYYCGPIGFMVATERVLDELGVPRCHRHSEAFAPDPSFAVDQPASEQHA